MEKPYLFGIHAEPPEALVWVYRALPFVIVLMAYSMLSMTYLAENPGGKLFPSFTMMGMRLWDLAFSFDARTQTYLLWADTYTSLFRFGMGLALGAALGLLIGVNMALFPGMRYMLLPFVTAVSNIPTLALLPLILLAVGIGDMAKVTLIFLGVVFYIARDMYTSVSELPEELLVKARTLGASQLGLVYRVVLPMVMPRLFEAVRLSLGIAWWSLIASEGIAATEGLGYRIFLMRRYLDMAGIIPYVVWITLLAFTINYALVYAQRYLYPWKQE
ncbi:ABC transporter permease subunit [Candidatus Kaiserbacteria bacterium]|nr:ABC transporter permease subunit [Candidatus Kaiserbacteria bacterium]